MKLSAFFPLVCVLALTSCSCANHVDKTLPQQNKQLSQHTATHEAAQKNPVVISFYSTHSIPKKNYTVLGKAVVSAYNHGGIKRQEAVINDVMRNLAASAGGDAIIDIKHHHAQVTGTIITFADEVVA